MKIFETIHVLLMAGFLFGVPVAATMRPDGQAFSWSRALTQAGVITLILFVLLALNFVVARLVLRRFSHR